MKALVNITSTLGKKTGIGYYATALLAAFQRFHSDLQIDTFPKGLLLRLNSLGSRVKNNVDTDHSATGSLFQSLGSLTSSVKKSLLKALREMNRLANRASFRLFLNKSDYDLYHEPNYIPYPIDLPTVVTIPDLSVLLHPEWHPTDRARYFEKYFHKSIQNCSHFLAISESVNQELVTHLGISSEKVTTTPLGIRDGLGPLPDAEVQSVLKSLRLPPQYLLHLGTLEPRKNLLFLMKTYCSLPEAIRQKWPLLLVGKWGWNTKAIADYYHSEAKHKGVLHIGYVPDSAMSALYNGARALLFPSHYEGFGLPPLEMMACGGAVIASTADAIAETVGKKAHLISPEDTADWRDAIHRVVSDNEWHAQLQRGTIQHAQRYSWRRCAEATRAAYHIAIHGEETVRRAA